MPGVQRLDKEPGNRVDEESRLPEESMTTPVSLVVDMGWGGVGVMAFRLAQGLTWLAVAEKSLSLRGSI